MRQFFKFKKGVIPIAVILIVLLASTAIVYYVVRNQTKSRAVNSPVPTGTIHANPTTVFEYGFKDAQIVFTATDVVGANGGQIDNVRYYLLNPTLVAGNNWGSPDWCSTASCDSSGYITYDISQSSNPGDNYRIIWDPTTHSSGSTSYSRALTTANIPPGTYKVGLRVEDVNGNVQGMATSLTVVLTQSKTPPPVVASPSPSPNVGLKIDPSNVAVSLRMARGGIGLKAFNLTSTGATKFELYTPTPSFGILFSPSSGNIVNGSSIPIYIKSSVLQPVGVYNGTISYSSNLYPGQISTGIPTNITLDPGSSDTDGDGFSNYLENKIGTDPNYKCIIPNGISAWPPDLDNSRQVDISDVVAVVQKVGTNQARYDLNVDGKVDTADVGTVQKTYYFKSCTP